MEELMNPDFWNKIGTLGQNWDSFGTVIWGPHSVFRRLLLVEYDW